MNNDEFAADWFKRVRNVVASSDGGEVNNKGVAIILYEYERLRESYKQAILAEDGQ